ncbi:MAG TPA: HD domain-containing protein [Candidatus Paceibacterota bacterium]|nr:HD domain-containing protein [Candidatus Paceibacterota bacterium]
MPRTPGEQRPPVSAESAESLIASRALTFALASIKERFETGPEEDRLTFHNQEHTEGVVRRAEAIAKAMHLPVREQLLTKIAAAFHDVVQKWEPDAKESGAVMRKRMVRVNEQESADEAVAWMRASGESFTQEEEALVRAAITATVPTWDPENGTVKQTDLESDVHPITRAVALADLGAAGMETAVSNKEGIALFAEENIDFTNAVRDSKGDVTRIPEADQEQYQRRCVRYLQQQVTFIEGRQKRLEVELEGLAEPARSNVAALFSAFEASLEQAKVDAQTFDILPFEAIARRLVPDAFAE